MIVVPFTDLHTETASAVPEAAFVRVGEGDEYRQLLRELWLVGETFTLVEHDVVPKPAQLASLDGCPLPWCGYGYGPGDWTPVFGCIRFRAEMIAALPGAWDDPSWPWMQLDAKFAAYARARGFRHHWHYPHVRHARVPHNRAPGGVYEVVRGPLTLDEQLAVLRAELRLVAAATRGEAGSSSDAETMLSGRDVQLEGGPRG